MKQRKALSNDRYQEIRDALAMGPTPGPWCVLDVDSEPYITARLPENEGRRWDDPTICRLYEDVTPFDSVTFGPCLEALPNAKANGSFIAACDPDTAQALLEERDALRDALKELITWIPSADIYLRLGFDPKAPMRALRGAKEALAKGDAA